MTDLKLTIRGLRARPVNVPLQLPLLTAGGPAIYCAQARVHAMPCCKTSTPCNVGMKASACCTLDPTPASPGKTTGAEVRSAASSLEKRHAAEALETPAPAARRGGPLARADRLWYLPAHDGSAPLYLRNASILR